MQLIFKDFKKGIVKIKIESIDDLWSLHLLIEPGDIISGKTIRKIKVGEDATVKKQYIFH